jgi:futalosine hydrolase
MYLLVAATEAEIEKARSQIPGHGAQFLVTGMGPVEATLALTKHLGGTSHSYQAVINVGTAGAFIDTGLGLLDACLAGKEVIGDLGICLQDRIAGFSPSLAVPREFSLTGELLARAERTLAAMAIPCRVGTFVTVSCVSGTRTRGDQLRDRHQAICENMEGAALARVCQSFELPFLELRCISNMVEERNTGNWRLAEAATHACAIAAQLVTAWASPLPGAE